MELTNTAYVVLGALAERPRSGYDIKRFADKAIRLFWAVGFAQLYPELRNLSEAGLIDASDTSVGGRRRTEYRLTDLGREALADWVTDSTTPPQEIRDELLVRMFFSDVVEPEVQADLAKRIADRHRAMRAAIQKEGSRLEELPSPELAMHREIQQFGIAHHAFIEQWFEQLAQRLSATDKGEDR